MTPSPGGGKDEKQDRYDRPTPDHEGNEAAEIEPPHSNNGRGPKEDDGAAGRARVKSRCNAEDRGSADEVARPSPNLWGQRAGPMGRHPLVDEDAHDSVRWGTASDPPWGGSGKVPPREGGHRRFRSRSAPEPHESVVSRHENSNARQGRGVRLRFPDARIAQDSNREVLGWPAGGSRWPPSPESRSICRLIAIEPGAIRVWLARLRSARAGVRSG
jgi:hypothetical protein